LIGNRYAVTVVGFTALLSRGNRCALNRQPPSGLYVTLEPGVFNEEAQLAFYQSPKDNPSRGSSRHFERRINNNDQAMCSILA
jgi:hypothetical protein